MPRVEQFYPADVFRRFQEWRATNKAKNEFATWQLHYPIEAEILNLLDLELKHKTDLGNPRRARIGELARIARRELGFGDHLVPYARELPFRVEEYMVRDGMVIVPEELKLLKEVNHGFWARVGFFTKGVRRLRRIG